MTETPFVAGWLRALLLAAALCAPSLPAAAQASERALRIGDYIVAVVNSELVTAIEVEQRVARAREEARRAGARLPPADELRKQVVDALIDERVLVTYARDSGVKVDEAELDRAVASVAAQNRLSLRELRERLAREGLEFARFRSSLRDQLLVERVREREVQARIRVTDAEIDRFVEQQRGAAAQDVEVNLAQILVTVPEGAAEAAVAERRARIEQAAARLRSGADFAAVARELSDDANRLKGGEIGLRPQSRLPDPFVEATRGLAPGEVTPTALRTGAGFHLLKVVERRDAPAFRIMQTRARHILLRTSAQARCRRTAAPAPAATWAGSRRAASCPSSRKR
jgi:peptidyl-prolyl cis-trans isomerase SurA